MRILTRWTLAACVLGLPYVLLMLAGWRWLYEQGWLLWWAIIAGVILLGERLVSRHLATRQFDRAATSDVSPSPHWSPYAEQAWQKVIALADNIRRQNPDLETAQQWWTILDQVLDTVAHHYHPQSANARLEMTVPHLLKIVELVARDLREATAGNVPGAHMLTIQDLVRLRETALTGQNWYARGMPLYRLVRFGLNPLSAMVREVAGQVENDLLDRSVQGTKGWILDYYVKKSGYYAIEMYSGRLVLDEAAFADFQTRDSSQDARRAVAATESITAEPLRVLVLGQVKAGKSSLINALFGETQAAVDVVPRTKAVAPFQLQRSGIPRAIILDTPGYDDPTGRKSMFAAVRDEAMRCDLVLMVCSALSAARKSDRRLLDEWRETFQQQPDRVPPPLLVVLTHIDKLRPLAEWNPPYDIARPENAKARTIAECVQAVADDLQLTPDKVVPVCLLEGQVYNVDEGLMPAIAQALPDAKRVKHLRALDGFHDAEYWHRLWQQSVRAGRLLASAGLDLVRGPRTKTPRQ